MFTTEYFIWLGISIVLIIGGSILLTKFKCPTKYVLYTVTIIAFLDKIVTFATGFVPTIGVPGMNDPHAAHLVVDYLPLHLCSIQCFFFLYILVTKNESAKNWMMTFTTVCMLMGAPFAILLPGYPMVFNSVGSYQMCITHSTYIIYAIYMISSKQLKVTGKIWIMNLLLMTFLSFCAIWINSMIIECGTYANFFYVMQPPAPGLPYLNLNQGWPMYVLKLAILTYFLMSLFHLPYICSAYVKNKDKVTNELEAIAE